MKDATAATSSSRSALQSFGYLLLDEHLHTCVVDDVNEGNMGSIDEVMELIKKIK